MSDIETLMEPIAEDQRLRLQKKLEDVSFGIGAEPHVIDIAIRGLLLLELEADGFLEHANIDLDLFGRLFDDDVNYRKILGVGHGMSNGALKILFYGLLYQTLEAYQRAPYNFPTVRGRPRRVDATSGIDSHRAFALWVYIHEKEKLLRGDGYSPSVGVNVSNRDILAEVDGFDFGVLGENPFKDKPHQPNLETSVSRGKTALGIDHLWRSSTCEAIWRI
ncbi:hypothetical protein [Aliiruegeria haliotis]|uniref:hypothetical protein n=1 Tax=Aliiruegeria haliotis TaxID=1280846 RepID=UPI0011B21E89|nr:hypothetical protein [Aliiruegeria haliotis]